MLKSKHPALTRGAVALGLWLAAMPATAHQGDMNCDGAIGSADVPLFVDALLGVSGFGGCDVQRADMNGDLVINGADTAAFVSVLLANPCFGGQKLCGGVCTEVELDPANCGSCGNQCGLGEHCAGGICQPAEP